MITDRSAARADGGLWIGTPDGRLIAALRDRSASMTVALSIAERRQASFDYDLSNVDVEILDGRFVASIGRSFFQTRSFRRLVRDVERRSDVVLVQLPVAAVLGLSRPQKPRVYQVVSDIRSIVFSSTYYQGMKRVAARGMSTFIDAYQRRLVQRRHARVVTHGRALLDRYGAEHGCAVVSSSILRNEILSVPRRRSLDAPFRVLYVGFLRHEKGVDVLLEAFEKLLDSFPDAELEVVGATDLFEHGVSDELRAAAERLKTRTMIHLRGHLAFGPDLFQAYADADVCVLPSRSEGTPRVLIEARAFGCPVIGTRVGGVPESVDDEQDGLLVPAGNVLALTQAMLRIATNRQLRERLTAGGLARARRTTIDDFADTIMSEARRAISPEAR